MAAGEVAKRLMTGQGLRGRSARCHGFEGTGTDVFGELQCLFYDFYRCQLPQSRPQPSPADQCSPHLELMLLCEGGMSRKRPEWLIMSGDTKIGAMHHARSAGALVLCHPAIQAPPQGLRIVCNGPVSVRLCRA